MREKVDGGGSATAQTTSPTAGGDSGTGTVAEPQVDMHELARQVYDEIKRRLATDRERSRF
jgi:hypothetical protein